MMDKLYLRQWLLVRPVVAIIVSVLLSACPRAASPQASVSTPTAQGRPYEHAVQLFAYDPQAPLDIEEVSVEQYQGLTIHDITYVSPKGGRVPAYLVVPPGAGPFAGIIVQHGLGGSRREVMFHAIALAHTGAVTLAIDAPYNRRENVGRAMWPLTFTEQDRAEQIQLIIDLRRGVDLLQARADVDAKRIAYVGYSYGATMGGLLAGVEHRIKAYGLMVGGGGLVAHHTAGGQRRGALLKVPKAQQDRWVALMEPIEPIHFVAHAAPSALFFQNALRDQEVSQEEAKAYQAAGSEPKRVEWYDSNHRLPPQAFVDQAEWLARQIGIDATKLEGP